MATRKMAKECRCKRCGTTYTSMMRLLHHQAADHSPRTLKDMRTMKDIRHSTGS